MQILGKYPLSLFFLAALSCFITSSYTNASPIDSSSVDSSKVLYIIVHGTWAQHEAWAQPGGDFFETMQRTVENSQLNADKVRVASFSWSGKNDHAERQQSAQKLATALATLPKDTAITLIAHSHGANVCFLASQLLAHTGHTIKTLYALGTPIDRARYSPNMNVIGSLYNLFSFGDPIQTVSGCFERALPPHPRITNIALTCNGSRPNHAELHSPLVAHWLTALPILSYNRNSAYGSLSLFNNNPPHYSINNQLPTLLENEKKLYAALALYMVPRNKAIKYIWKKSYSHPDLPECF